MDAGKDPHGLFQRFGAHVVGRRIDEVTRQDHAAGQPLHPCSVGAFRQGEPKCLRRLLAVAGEDIAAEHEGQRRKLRF
jgi:hypothetical protein